MNEGRALRGSWDGGIIGIAGIFQSLSSHCIDAVLGGHRVRRCCVFRPRHTSTSGTRRVRPGLACLSNQVRTALGRKRMQDRTLM
jgi:hypothetical protein